MENIYPQMETGYYYPGMQTYQQPLMNYQVYQLPNSQYQKQLTGFDYKNQYPHQALLMQPATNQPYEFKTEPNVSLGSVYSYENPGQQFLTPMQPNNQYVTMPVMTSTSCDVKHQEQEQPQNTILQLTNEGLNHEFLIFKKSRQVFQQLKEEEIQPFLMELYAEFHITNGKKNSKKTKKACHSKTTVKKAKFHITSGKKISLMKTKKAYHPKTTVKKAKVSAKRASSAKPNKKPVAKSPQVKNVRFIWKPVKKENIEESPNQKNATRYRFSEGEHHCLRGCDCNLDDSQTSSIDEETNVKDESEEEKDMGQNFSAWRFDHEGHFETLLSPFQMSLSKRFENASHAPSPIQFQ